MNDMTKQNGKKEWTDGHFILAAVFGVGVDLEVCFFQIAYNLYISLPPTSETKTVQNLSAYIRWHK